jgi:pilus assembly protein FimV
MAHSSKRGQRQGVLRWAACLAIATAAPSFAIGLGDLEVRSSLGEILDASVAIAPSEGESVATECFALARGAADGTHFITRATLTVEGDGASRRLRIRTFAPVNEPAITLRVNAACPRGGGLVSRDFIVLLDPRARRAGTIDVPAASDRTAAPQSAPRLQAPDAAVAPSDGAPAGFESRPEDTLKSISTSIFPRNRGARRVFIEALREENPALAALKDDEPIPAGSPLKLPDLRTFAKGRSLASTPARPAATAGEAAPVPKAPKQATAPQAPKPARVAPVAAPKAPLPAAKSPAATSIAPPAPEKSASRAAGSAFQLKLSAPEIDLARSRGVNEQTRAKLRERQLILDADDQLSALLSLRNSMKVLEGRVAELQLKLSTVASIPPPSAKVETTPAKIEPPVVAKPAPPAVAKVEAAPAPLATPAPAPAKVEPVAVVPVPKAEPETAAAPAKTEPVASTPIAKLTPVVPSPAEKSPAPDGLTLPDWLWGVVALLVLAVAWIGLRIMRRRAAQPAFVPEDPIVLPHSIADDNDVAAAPMFEAEPPAMVTTRLPAPLLVPVRRTMDSDASLTTSITAGDPSDLRRRYIEERFPEIGARTIELEEPDSIVKGARLFYEDGALPRAVELLQFAIEEKPDEIKRWLALFEIFRLERLTGEFAELASRFQEYHGQSEYWAKVQYFGREVDPSNPLYQEETLDDIETVGLPASARKLQALVFDPLAENWLNAPMDFSSEVLATQLRAKLMESAGITEAELIPNPMSALKNVEMFTVA